MQTKEPKIHKTSKPTLIHVDPNDLETSFKSLGPSIAVTKGHFEFPVSCDARDHDWNHMDQQHRPHIHHTYANPIRVVREQNFALTLTCTPILKFPFMVLLTDTRVDVGVFYQAFTLFNLVYVHSIIRSIPRPTPEGELSQVVTDWYVVSHRFFKFLHPLIEKKLRRVNEMQNQEDESVRIRRTELRKKGFCFSTDAPNYINSNSLTSNTQFPKLEKTYHISLESLTPLVLNKVSIGPIDLLVLPKNETGGATTIWFSDCPHEGGPLEAGKQENDMIRCPWHSLAFKGLELGNENPGGTLGNLQIMLDKNELVVSQVDEERMPSSNHLQTGMSYIHPNDLISHFKSLDRSFVVTTGHFEFPADCSVQDLDWNHMDQNHRIYIHHTYQNSIRLIRSANFTLTLSNNPIWKLPFFILMVDIRVNPNMFYQAFSLLNIIYIHSIIRSVPRPTPKSEYSTLVTDWYIVSHPIFKFLHSFLEQKLLRINRVQNNEDAPVRVCRSKLREKGYSFNAEDRDFVNSNILAPNVRPPKLTKTYRVPLHSIKAQQMEKIAAGPIDLLIRREKNDEVMIWLADCPHEGGPLDQGELVDGYIQCPWHHLKFSGLHLIQSSSQGILGRLQIRLDRNELIVDQTQD